MQQDGKIKDGSVSHFSGYYKVDSKSKIGVNRK